MIDWERELVSAAEDLLSGVEALRLAESIRYSLLSGGKRFRPRLMEASAQLLNVSSAAFAPFAIGLELIHAFTLIHDDLPCMDDDDLRRGKPTNHKVYGEALALLAGDALVPLAFESCFRARAHVSEALWARALSRLIRLSGPHGVIGGQALEMTIHQDPSLDKLRRMHSLKTGALFDAALLIPADLAGIDPSSTQMGVLTRFSRAFGLAFQTADDLDDANHERDQVSGEFQKTNVLYYLSTREAQQQASVELVSAAQDIQRHWPLSSSGVMRVAEQLRLQLQGLSS